MTWTAAAATFGLLAGCVGGSVRHMLPQQANYPFLAEQVPLPHHVPQYQGGLSLRFAMVHDVIHERFPKHGAAHYRERNRRTSEQLAALAPDDPAAFPLNDDLAAELERLGRSEAAAVVMRAKLARQQAKGITRRDLYSSYANLGTFLTLATLSKAVAGDWDAQQRFREGFELVKKSVEVNPEAHFGRERWQVALYEHLLRAMDDPDVLRHGDFLGNSFATGIEEMLDREANWMGTGYGRAVSPAFTQGKAFDEVPAFFRPDVRPDDPDRWAELNPIRKHITRVGSDYEPHAVPPYSVPFDEPVLGIIGMWRQGAGANAHFALALGEVMLRVGQRHIAWAAFERASRLADRFWPNPAHHGFKEFLQEHCRKRQADIERTLAHPASDARRRAWQNDGPPLSPEEIAALRLRFEAELAHGEGYLRLYQEYEEKQIAAGVPLADEHFYDAFHAGREPIASAVGPEEWFARAKMSEYASERRWAWATFGAGLMALLVAGLYAGVPRGRRQRQCD